MALANESRTEAEHMEHHAGAGKYLLVWIALLVLTVITVVTGRMDLGAHAYNLALALVIATIKGTLVVLFFMHLAEHQGANRLVFSVSIVFVLLLIGLSIADPITRFAPSNSPGSVKGAFKPYELEGGASAGGAPAVQPGHGGQPQEGHH